MEAQPIALVLIFFPLFFSGQLNIPFLNASEIAIILLSLHLWTIFTLYLGRSRNNEGIINTLQIAGLVVTLLALAAIELAVGISIGELIIGEIIVVWAWRRGILWTGKEGQDERLVQTFKIGFAVVLVVLIMGILRFSETSYGDTTATLKQYVLGLIGQALPIFFLSGVLALSFSRLAIIRKENARSGGSRIDHTRTWQAVLTVLWVAIIGIGFLLEAFSLQPLRALFAPIVGFFAAIINAIIYGFAYLLNLIFGRMISGHVPQPNLNQQQSKSQPIHHQVPGHLPPTSPLVNIILFTVLGIIALVLLIVIVRLALKRQKAVNEDDEMEEEEERENLSLNDILKARRNERQRRQQAHENALALEALAPNSARARYRELLLATEKDQGNLMRRNYETPQEYKSRLQRAVPTGAIEDGVPTNPAILEELTSAYDRERYGGKQTEQPQQSFLQTWMPRLLQHFTASSKPSPRPQTPPAGLPNKWGD